MAKEQMRELRARLRQLRLDVGDPDGATIRRHLDSVGLTLPPSTMSDLLHDDRSTSAETVKKFVLALRLHQEERLKRQRAGSSPLIVVPESDFLPEKWEREYQAAVAPDPVAPVSSEPTAAAPDPVAPVSSETTAAAPDPPGRRRWTLIGVGTLALLLVSVVGGFLITNDNNGQPPDDVSPMVDFESPTNGAAVTSPLLVRGTATIPPGKVLWIVTQPPDGAFYPAVQEPVTVDSSGAWYASVHLGGASPRNSNPPPTFYIHAVLAPQTNSAIEAGVRRADSRGDYARFDVLPNDSRSISDVQVYLR